MTTPTIYDIDGDAWTFDPIAREWCWVDTSLPDCRSDWPVDTDGAGLEMIYGPFHTRTSDGEYDEPFDIVKDTPAPPAEGPLTWEGDYA